MSSIIGSNTPVVRSSLGILFALWCSACSSSSSPKPDDIEPDAGATTAPVSETSEPGASGSSEPTDPTHTPDGGDTGSDAATSEPTSDETDVSDTSASSGDGGVTSAPEGDGGGTEAPDGGNDGDPWANCPAATVPENAEWPIEIHATENAVYCATFNETRTLQEEQQAKMQLRVAPGVHHIPDVDQEQLVLPVCFRDTESSMHVSGGGLTVSKTQSEGNATYNLRFEHTFGERDPRHFNLTLDQTFEGTQDATFELNGVENTGFDSYQSMDLCEIEGDYCFPSIIFTSCAYASGELNSHVVELDGGEVTFELRLGESFAGTEPGAFVEARGTYQGEAFVQKDYFRLVYHPSHHHFERAFVVLFDEPRGAVCGIEVSNLEPFGDDVPDQAFTVDCELNHLDEIDVKSHLLTRGEQ